MLALMVSGAQSATIRCTSTWEEPSDPSRRANILAFFHPAFPPFGLCQTISIMGRIEKGDFAVFRDLYRSNHPALTQVHLISPGGDAREAMAIGQFLRKYLLRANAPSLVKGSGGSMGALARPGESMCPGPNCICASACALIWFGAVRREGTVGLHRPVIGDVSFPSMEPEEASKGYRQVLGEISDYMAKMEVPPDLIERMVSTDSSEITWTGSRDFRESLILSEPPSIAEWINSSCGSITKDQITTLTDLFGARQKGTRLAAPDEAVFKDLWGKFENRTTCADLIMNIHRAKLSPP